MRTLLLFAALSSTALAQQSQSGCSEAVAFVRPDGTVEFETVVCKVDVPEPNLVFILGRGPLKIETGPALEESMVTRLARSTTAAPF